MEIPPLTRTADRMYELEYELRRTGCDLHILMKHGGWWRDCEQPECKRIRRILDERTD